MSIRATGWVPALLESAGVTATISRPLTSEAVGSSGCEIGHASIEEQRFRLALWRTLQAYEDRGRGLALWREAKRVWLPAALHIPARVRTVLRREGYSLAPVEMSRKIKKEAA